LKPTSHGCRCERIEWIEAPFGSEVSPFPPRPDSTVGNTTLRGPTFENLGERLIDEKTEHTGKNVVPRLLLVSRKFRCIIDRVIQDDAGRQDVFEYL
jgi:hypothetical protein